jgi:hypothetical protein
MAWVRVWLCKLQKRYTRLAGASDKVYQLLAHGRWFSPGTPASSTTKTGCYDIAEIKNQSHLRYLSWLPQFANGCDDITEILLKVALNTITLLCQMKMSFNTIYNSND